MIIFNKLLSGYKVQIALEGFLRFSGTFIKSADQIHVTAELGIPKWVPVIKTETRF